MLGVHYSLDEGLQRGRGGGRRVLPDGLRFRQFFEPENVPVQVYQSECFTKQTVHQVEDDVPQCRTIEEEKCEEVKEGYTTSLKCDKVGAVSSIKCLMFASSSGQGRCAPWRNSRSRSTPPTPPAPRSQKSYVPPKAATLWRWDICLFWIVLDLC